MNFNSNEDGQLITIMNQAECQTLLDLLDFPPKVKKVFTPEEQKDLIDFREALKTQSFNYNAVNHNLILKSVNKIIDEFIGLSAIGRENQGVREKSKFIMMSLDELINLRYTLWTIKPE